MNWLVKIVLLCALMVPSASWAQWTNEPSGATEVLDCNFTSTPGACGILDAYSSSFLDSDATAPVSPSGVLRSTIQAGQHSGGMQLNYVIGPGGATYNEMFVGLMWRTNAGFEGRPQGNKTFFMRGPGSNGVFLFDNDSLSGGSGPMVFFHNTGSLDNSHACSLDLGLACYPNAGGPNLTRGTWTKLEAYMKKSTTCTSRDGIVRWWIDGVLTGNYTNLNYACLGLNEWVWAETWDGTPNFTVTTPWSHYLDHLYISIPNCPSGCATTGGGTTPPPPLSPPPPPPSSGDYVYQSQYSGTQGSGQWSYRDTAGNLLTYNGGTNLWTGAQSYMTVWSSGFHPGTTNGTVVRWTAPEDGTATITGSAQKADLAGGDGITFQVKYGATTLFSQAIGATDGTAYPYSVSQAMTAGETVDFIVLPGAGNTNDSTHLNPVIAWVPDSGASPTVSGFSPSSGAPGTSVVITGTNFVPSLTGQTVTFSNIAAAVTAASATSITAVVPPHAITGTIQVTTTEGTGTSGSNFTVPLSGTVETVTDVSASALSATSVTVQFTALSDGTGAAAKHDVRIAAGTISWGDASSVASGTCSTPYAPGVTNTVVTCTITGLTTGTQYDVQLVPYRGTLDVDAVFGSISNIATVTPIGTITDETEICRREDGWRHPVSTRACLAPMPPMPPLPAMQ